MIKNFKIESILFGLLLVNIFVSYKLDLGLYLYFRDFNKNLSEIALKDFFVNISTLGDSFWYFLISIVMVVLIFIKKKLNLLKTISFKNLNNFFYFLFLSLIFNGLLTQALKHLIGRVRPNHATFDGSFGFNFMSLDSSFHSFPSGHTSTIFILALVLSRVVPNLKYFFMGYASIIAFSRVVVGAHFLTDIFGGVLTAVISYKIINIVFYSAIKNIRPEINRQINQSVFFLFIMVMILLILIFAIGPTLDLFFASLFYKGDGQFSLQSFYSITILIREILLPIVLIYILILPIISKYVPLKKLFFGHSFSFLDIFFIWTALIINNLIVINLILKNLWGRARPNEVLQLGGKESFTPWFKIADNCSSNCSFVSGDASVGFALVVLYFVTKNKYYMHLALFFGTIFGIVRMAEGGHFFSDVLISGTIVFVFSCFIKNVFNKYYDY